MPTKDLILAIDNGTQSLKAMIFDPAGQLLAKEAVTFVPYFSQRPTWAEQDPEVFWQALVEACQRIWQHPDIDRDRVAGVALTTQRGSVVNVDKNGKPLRPAMLWPDQRKTYGLPPVSGSSSGTPRPTATRRCSATTPTTSTSNARTPTATSTR